MAIHRPAASAPYLGVRIFANDRRSDSIALLDTGASMTSVHPDIIRAQDAQVIGVVDVLRVNRRSEPSYTYYLARQFGEDSPLSGVEVVAAVPASPCRILIGRDLMSRWVMTVDEPGDQRMIAY